MSQSAGLLNEEEVKNFINEYYGLKTDREQYLKPTTDFLVDIYSTFLDDFQMKWREPIRLNEYQTYGSKVLITMGVRNMIKNYCSEFEFNIYDLLRPNRKRTNYFLNALIFIKAQIEEYKGQLEAWKSDWYQKKQFKDDKDKEKAALKLEIEKLEIWLANAGSVEVSQKDLNDKKDDLSRLQSECDRVREIASKTKSELSSRVEYENQLRSKLQKIVETNMELEKTLDTLKQQDEREEMLRKQLDTKEHQRDSMRTEWVTKLEQADLNSKRKSLMMEKSLESIITNIENLKSKVDIARKERARIKSNTTKNSQLFENLINKIQLSANDLIKKANDSNNDCGKFISTMVETRRKQENLLGIVKEQQESASNRTYTLFSANRRQ